jgi:hypothetical protein
MDDGPRRDTSQPQGSVELPPRAVGPDRADEHRVAAERGEGACRVRRRAADAESQPARRVAAEHQLTVPLDDDIEHQIAQRHQSWRRPRPAGSPGRAEMRQPGSDGSG